MIDKKILIGIGIGICLVVLVLAGISLYGKLSKQNDKYYLRGYSNATNNTWTSIWKSIDQDGCINLPVPYNNSIERFKFCVVGK